MAVTHWVVTLKSCDPLRLAINLGVVAGYGALTGPIPKLSTASSGVGRERMLNRLIEGGGAG